MSVSRSRPPLQPPLTLFSVVIPAHNEEESLPPTLRDLYAVLQREQIPHEIVVVDDNSKDRTWQVLQDLRAQLWVILHEKDPIPHAITPPPTRTTMAQRGFTGTYRRHRKRLLRSGT